MGGLVSTPVINRPEVAIIAVNKVKEMPVVVDGDLEIRKMMNLSLSCDHRVVDGWDAASFIQELRKLLENPLRRSEAHTSELQSLMRISYAVFCLTKKNHTTTIH